MRKKTITSQHTKRNAHFSPDLTVRMKGYFTGSILSLGVLTSMGQLNAQEDVSLIQKEINRRSENVNQAQLLLKDGDVAYKAGDFKKSVESYQQAFELIPEAGLTHQLRFAVGDRYAQAAVEYGKVLARTGQYDIAKGHLNAVLEEDVAPGNAGAMKMLAKLDDPIRYSPTLTPEHVRNIEKVAHWLRKGESYFLQAQYDEALIAYEEALKIDPTNKAARRGMDRVVESVRSYSVTARDHLRTKALTQIDALWEMKIRPDTEIPVLGAGDSPVVGERVQNVRGSKLKQIMIPSVEFDDVSFSEAINTVRVWARELDTTELDPAKKGMNFVMRLGDESSGFRKKIENVKVNLNLTNVPLTVVLDYITQQTGTYWRQEQFAVVIRPRGSYTAELESRTFRVPVGFMDNDDEEKTDDVFGNSPALQAKVGIVDALKRLGIAFPDGATAFYNRSNNTLRVTNAPLELDAIETYIRAQSMSESVMVVIKTTIIEVSETVLNELGYDWLIDPTHVKNNVFLTGGTQGSGDVVRAVTSPVGGAGITGNPFTSGNRSGDTMFQANSIDARIAGINTPAASRASAPLTVTSQINDSTFQGIVRALSQKDGQAKLNESTTVSLAGQRVELSSVSELTYPSEYEPPEIPQAAVGANAGQPVVVTPSSPTAFENRALGYQILVEPTVSDDKNYIDLQLNPSIVTFDGFINYGSPLFNVVIDPITGIPFEQLAQANTILMPVFRTVRLNTGVTVQDGATVVVGGLIQQKIETINDKVPMLGDLPLVGRFFQSQGLKSTKTAIIMFVKVELVDPTGHPWRDR
ncbi:MAG: general secretion pathway protein D [Cryomorphaceae bacterium]|jgi:general secretion pathway protein D